MDPNVIHDPVFLDLLKKHEIAGRKLRDAVIALRGFHLLVHKSPQELSTSEKWRAAHLEETAVQRLDDVRDAAANLLRYGVEIAPHSSDPDHLVVIQDLKAAHQVRLDSKSGHKADPLHRGIEEQVHVDGGKPITIVIKPQHYEFTERHRKSQERRDQSSN